MLVGPIRPRFSLEDLITCLILLACSEELSTGIDGSPPSGFGCLMIGSSNQWVLRYSSKLDRLSQCMAAEVDQGKKKYSKVAHLCSQPRLQIPVYLGVTTWSSRRRNSHPMLSCCRQTPDNTEMPDYPGSCWYPSQ